MSSTRWTLLGPTGVLDGQMHLPSTPNGPTIAGRVTCLVRGNAGAMFIGTAGGGVWHSGDEGVSWRPLTDRLPCASIGALAFDAANHRLWIGSGEGNRAGRAMFGQGLFMLDTTTLGNATPTITRFTNLPAPRGADDFRALRSAQILLEPDGANPPIVWWATNDGLFRSTDSGGAWTQVTFNGRLSDDVASMVLCTSQGTARMLVALWDQRLYVRRAADPTQFDALTTDLGALPAVAAMGQRIILAVAPSNAERVYLALGRSDNSWDGIFKSDAGGKGWTRMTLPAATSPQRPLGQSHYNIILSVHPTTPDTLYFGETGIWRSTDGGSTWTDLASATPGTHSDQHALAFDAADPTRVWLGNDGGVWLSTDGGSTWSSRNRGLATLQYYALVHHPTVDSVLLAGAQDNGTQRYAGHPGWSLIGGGDGFFCAIDPIDPRYWYASYVYRDGSGNIAAIQRSDAAGANWVTKTSGIDPTEYGANNEPFYVPFVCDPVAPQVLWLGTTRLWRSQDRGESWQAVRKADGTFFSTTAGTPFGANSIKCIAVDPNDNTNVYVGTGHGRLFRVHIDSVAANGQATVTVTQARTSGAAPLPDLREFTDVAVPKLAAPGALAPVYAVQGSSYLTFSGFAPTPVNAGRIWKYDFTSGAAPDWTALGTTLPAVTFPSGPALGFEWNFVNAIAIDPANVQRLFVGCHMGVFESVDGGASWTPAFGTDLPLAPVVDLQFHPAHRLLRAATMGRSVWERPVDPLGAPETQADLYIRDNVIDIGRFDTPDSGTDPLAASGTLAWFDAVDIKVDSSALFEGGFQTAPGTIDYTPAGALDYVGFQKLGSEGLLRDCDARVHLQVLNRGPASASNVKARVYWCERQADGNFPALPASFWASFPDGALADGGSWHAVAAAQTRASVAPGDPQVFTFNFIAPEGLHDVGLFAVVSCDEDPIAESRTDVRLVATTNKRTALRRADLSASTGTIVLGVLVAVGMAALVVGAVVATQ
ncbi:hypothetical protein QTH91_01065 [Variovorax dokdonensis]|uniref:Glycosyl hydrolase n=1 Tax=Variovorax dokdonensis TaxID=344883 RepID=A0ABT7N558_9BURK|nr:hypothetical protein [Variovorax dokdonensis]MDM0043060.1 hypothetical protein [Variovorax dokdonensis]